MDDKQIKQMLKDAGLYLIDASKSWPKYPDTANKRFEAASCLMEDVWDHMYYDNRPLGGEDDSE